MRRLQQKVLTPENIIHTIKDKEASMITAIGIVAGEIWHYLDQHGEVFISELIKGIDKPRDNVLMSLGWLAREGHVILQDTNGDYKVCLRKND
jgi:hypothetical protein